MNERGLFLSALEIDDPTARRAHLVAQCAGDADLMARVEMLLASHEGQSRFLNTPAVEQMDGSPATAAAATIHYSDGSTHDDEGDAASPDVSLTDNQEEQDDEIPLGYLQPSSEPNSLGRLGHYEVLEAVGRGAFGTVLRAFDKKLQRVVAIKVLAPEMAATSPARKRFLREARTSAAVRHENVVAIYAVEDEPIPYLVMEYIPGKTLQQRLDQQGPLGLADVLRLGKQVAEGLAAAHEKDLIHRDVKPGNILLEGGVNDRVKITDFGLARTADDASMTQSGMIAGTPLYMAPEQALGRKLDQRADLFSFGSVLYQMVSGRPPFRAPSTLAVLKRVAEDNPRPIQEIIPEAPDWMCELIGHLHAKNPDERYASAREVADLLDHCLAELGHGRIPNVAVSASSTSKVGGRSQPARPVRAPVRRSSLAVKAAALVLILLAGLSVTEFAGVTRLVATAFPRQSEAETLAASDAAEEASGGNASKQPPAATAGDEEDAGQHFGADDNAPRAVRLEPIEWPADAPPLAIAPFDAEQAKQHQQAWADYLGVPVEREIALGGKDEYGLDIKLSLVLIPPGEFLMGSSDEEIARLREQAQANDLRLRDFKWIDLEGPQRRVHITRPFYMSRTEVTNDQFRCFVDGADPHYKTEAEASGKGSWTLKNGRMVLDPSCNWRTQQGTDPGSPVTHVSWNDAIACCEWLSGQEGELSFTLPTEAQWEYACRAGTTTAWSSGDDEEVLKEYAIVKLNWYRKCGAKKPNPFGLYDMHGNAWEWCRDSIYNYRDAVTVDPVGPGGETRIIRGGNCFGGFSNDWHNGSGSRSAVRYEAAADHRVLDKGFRVVAALPEHIVQSQTAASERGDWALEFDGDDDFVATPLQFDGSTPLTIEATVEIGQWPDEGTSGEIVSDTHRAGASLGALPDGFFFSVRSGDEYILVRAPRDDQFLNRPVMLAGVLEGQLIKLFVDGQQVDQRTIPYRFLPSTETFSIGTSPGYGEPNDGHGFEWKGRISAVRISSAARYQFEYDASAELTADETTLALYRFDEGAGDVLHDASDNGHHGAIVGAKWVKPDSPPPDSNQVESPAGAAPLGDAGKDVP